MSETLLMQKVNPCFYRLNKPQMNLNTGTEITFVVIVAFVLSIPLQFRPPINPMKISSDDPVKFPLLHYVLNIFPSITTFEILKSNKKYDNNDGDDEWVMWLYLLQSVQSLSRIRLFATPWIAARQASLSITNSRSSPRLTSIESARTKCHYSWSRVTRRKWEVSVGKDHIMEA